MNKYFCTHFDSNYLPHAKSLHSSLIKHLKDAVLFMFCMDNKSFLELSKLNLKSAILIHHDELESFFPQLINAKKNRDRVEYFYTCSPLICNYIIQTNPQVDQITYLDSDLYFFDSPLPIFDELNGYSVGIIEHKFNFFTKRNKKYGNFNVGWVTFKKDANGLACLNDWSDKCLEWCYQKLETNRYADQKYLDYWQKDFKNVKVISNIGANVAIWNIKNYKILKRDNKIYIDDFPLIFYHFANLKQLNKNSFSTSLSRVFVSCEGLLKNEVYLPYLKEFLNHQNQDSISISKKDIHSKGFITFIRNCSRKVRLFFYNDIIKID